MNIALLQHCKSLLFHIEGTAVLESDSPSKFFIDGKTRPSQHQPVHKKIQGWESNPLEPVEETGGAPFAFPYTTFNKTYLYLHNIKFLPIWK
ncbi:hypothetical protein AWH48_13895 [Domibacillus aminovorans]|uniref:Uncharacterized protein n=1 Tax=Domibacillus aminovorans TaxID=29332 RepID=A0A177KJ44_9BACI|nr:hypothetical protein AWH48_13895 [Domibacillus aminovorans]